MTDLRVTPPTLTGHGAGCESLADKFGQLADLLNQAEVDDQCFGPLGEFLFSSYESGLRECQDLATKAQEFLVHTKEQLDETVKDYADTEQRIIDSLNKAGEGMA
ncbi:hypothetical protein [Saccharopolyspora mangrovi]|uniref:ESX-1 secretion-associated protein n=1 Tax=Saccharopolyspora mangrovi TaxID=3082379 RepID=A0ABU6A7T4_9PSEU|nr:hypothetical protein [Saccharopolyspora sp. S2-29]MEB3367566.1 hypothetical protein [Saccharopolyspora sp. S2-29]